MSLFHTNTLIGASGSGSGPLYVDDVFSTFLYEGTGSSLSINNGIDLDGEGGAVWIKARSNETYKNHTIVDSERGKDTGNSFKVLYPNLNDSEYSPGSAANATVSSFNSNGFTAGNNANTNVSSGDYVSWTFRKSPGFFDVVTYTGNGSNRTIAHNLGSVPGFIIIKAIDDTRHWWCFHRSIGNTKAIPLSLNQATTTGQAYWNNTDPTSTVFTVGTDADVNQNNTNYVAYLFAHDEQSFGTDSDEAIIKCGTYDGTNGNGNFVNVGFEPQWVLTKNTERTSTNWTIWDNMRGVSVGTFSGPSNGEAFGLHPNNSDADSDESDLIEFNPTGFTLNSGSSLTNFASGEAFIYIAIRRPHKPPTAGTDVFKAVTYSGSSSAQTITGAGFPPDWMWSKDTSAANNGWHHDRMRGENSLDTSGTGAEQDRSSYVDPLGQDGVKFVSGGFDLNRNGSNHVAQFFKRAPGFFDIVCFTGNNSSTQNITHNLNAVPEFFMIKKRDSTGEFQCYHSGLGNTKYVKWDNVAAAVTSSARWNDTTPTSSVFTLGSEFQDTNDYVAYLFATLSGISKVGSYSGTGNNIDVDCGFSGGARYILIKRTDTDAAGTIGNWYVYDHARGINAGNDPYLWLNTTAAQVSNTDYIDPLNAGFTVTSSAPDGLNQSGGTYIFFAIA